MRTEPAPQRDPKLFYLLQASRATGHDYWKKPDEARLAVFGRTLKIIYDAIHNALEDNTLTTKFGDKDLRRELRYIARAIRTMQEESKVDIPTPDATLTAIGEMMSEAIIRLNAAVNLETDTSLERRDKQFLTEYQQCYRECAGFIRRARVKIGNIGVDHLPK